MRVHYPPSEMHLLPVYTYYMALAGLACDLGGPHGQDIVKKIVPEITSGNILVDLALRDTQPALIRAAIDAAINLAKFLRIYDPILQADVLFNLSWVKLVVAGDSPEAEQLCNDALAIYETQENLDGRAQSTWLLGQILKTSKRQKECKLKFEEALALATEAQNQNCRAKCLSCLSEAQFHAGDAATAEALSLEVRPHQTSAALVSHRFPGFGLFRQEEHLTNIGMTLYFLGRIADFRDDASAEERYEEAEAVLQQAGASSHAALALIGKGDILVARCQYREAQQIYTKAVQAFRTNSSLQTTYGAFAQLSLGTAEAYLYNYTEAKRWLDAAWKTFEKTPVAPRSDASGYSIWFDRPESGQIPVTDRPPGDVAMFQNSVMEAATMYQRALTSAESLGLSVEESQCRVKLGAVHVMQGQVRVGLQHLLVAAAKQRKAQNIKGITETMVRLGEAFEADGDHPAALMIFRATYPAVSKTGALRSTADCLLGLGRLCSDRVYVDKAAQLYQQTDDPKGRERCRTLVQRL
ncbi:unnamed protein product [Mycena citricolor]|uniref:Uncharacterized protein n=1 Tax=Mycena citricolor TaxID=2018698 RepID=A0AAD2HRP7_9AGAR|nr:unnamed protein product [Mycena citricolor]